MLHIVHLHATGRALEQDLARVQRQWDGAPKNHEGDEGARCGVCVEALRVAGLPDNDGGDDDANVVDRVAYEVDQDAEHAQIAAGLGQLGRVVAVLCVGMDGALMVRDAHLEVNKTVGIGVTGLMNVFMFVSMIMCTFAFMLVFKFMFVSMSMSVSVSVSMLMIVGVVMAGVLLSQQSVDRLLLFPFLSRERRGLTMDECGTEEVQAKSNAAYDHDKHGIVDSCV